VSKELTGEKTRSLVFSSGRFQVAIDDRLIDQDPSFNPVLSIKELDEVQG